MCIEGVERGFICCTPYIMGSVSVFLALLGRVIIVAMERISFYYSFFHLLDLQI